MAFGGRIKSSVMAMASSGAIITAVMRSWDFGLMKEGDFIPLKMRAILFVRTNKEE